MNTGGGGGGNTNTNTNTGTGGNMNTGGGGGQNNAPSANAGPDQTVAAGAVVTLSGSGNDPDGDAVTLEWSTTSSITLSNVTASMPTFTAPTGASPLTFTLTVRDGRGGEATDSVTITVQAPVATLYALGNGAITSYRDPGTLNNEVDALTNLESGSMNQFFQPREIAVDRNNRLYIGSTDTNGDPAIVVYENASFASGSLTPARVVAGTNTMLEDTVAMAIDSAEDMLYVAREVQGSGDMFLVFDVATTAFNGNVPPDRTFQVMNDISPLQMVTSGRDLYVVLQGNNSSITVFDDADTLDGIISATRVITNSNWGSSLTIFVDSQDRLLAVDRELQVFIYNNASMLGGAPPPNAVLTVQVTGAGASMAAVVADAADRLIIADSGTHFIRVYDNLSTLTTSVRMPDRSFEADDLRTPLRLFLVQP